MLAQLATLDLIAKGYNVTNITFSTPPVGDANFVKLYNEKVQRSKHFVIDGDPAHHLDIWRSRRSKYLDVKGLRVINPGRPRFPFACPHVGTK